MVYSRLHTEEAYAHPKDSHTRHVQAVLHKQTHIDLYALVDATSHYDKLAYIVIIMSCLLLRKMCMKIINIIL